MMDETALLILGIFFIFLSSMKFLDKTLSKRNEHENDDEMEV